MKRLIAAVEKALSPQADFPRSNTYEWWRAYYAELRAALAEAKREIASRGGET